VPAALGPSGKLPQETGLADPRFARDLDRPRVPSIELVEHLLDHVELVGASDQPVAELFAEMNHRPR